MLIKITIKKYILKLNNSIFKIKIPFKTPFKIRGRVFNQNKDIIIVYF